MILYDFSSRVGPTSDDGCSEELDDQFVLCSNMLSMLVAALLYMITIGLICSRYQNFLV